MDPFKRNFLRHAQAVGAWMRERGATGGIDPLTLALEISCNGRTRRFTPQFFEKKPNGVVNFARELGDGVIGFVSWLPYRLKGWPIAQDKGAFKAFARARGVPTPESWPPGEIPPEPFIIKARRSSLGMGLRGPFPGGARVRMGPDEYGERFIFGALLKSWFWDGALVVAEVVGMPTVKGDGKHTLQELVAARLGPGVPTPRHLDQLARLQGVTANTVPHEGKSVIADYQYMSPLNPSITINHDVRGSIAGTPFEAQLLAAGRACADAIPEELRPGTVFSLDGVVDAKGTVWFLEANCNPLLHPSFYRHMLDDLFFRG